jgi:hypothetical protein
MKTKLIKMTDEMDQAVQTYLIDSGLQFSAYIRKLIERDLAARGTQLTEHIQWGGTRDKQDNRPTQDNRDKPIAQDTQDTLPVAGSKPLPAAKPGYAVPKGIRPIPPIIGRHTKGSDSE